MVSSMGKENPRWLGKLPEHHEALSWSPTFIWWQTWSKLPLLYNWDQAETKEGGAHKYCLDCGSSAVASNNLNQTKGSDKRSAACKAES